jgi:Sulfotransferase domain
MLPPMAADQASIGFVERARRGLAYRGAKALDGGGRAARRATAPLRLRPTYLVVGAQKSGTTSLHHYLSEHPAVLTARIKEVQYFTKYHARGEGWYRAQFPLVSSAWTVRRRLGVRPAVGEATAACLFDPRSPERVHAFDPALRLVAVLRDPVERAFSHFQMELRWGRETGTFEEALAREEAELPAVLERMREDPECEPADGLARTYVARGLYADQLERWLRLFPREQLLVLMSDELLDDPAGTMEAVAGFLGVPEWHAARYQRRGVREYAPMAPETRERLVQLFEPHDLRLAELLGRELPWSRQVAPAQARSAG